VRMRRSRLVLYFFFSRRRRHTSFSRDWSSDVCSSDLQALAREPPQADGDEASQENENATHETLPAPVACPAGSAAGSPRPRPERDRKSTRLNSSHVKISYAVVCLKKKIMLFALFYGVI